MSDYYSVLGVSENASMTEIKNAYRKLSKKFHPDVNQGDKYFEERFKEIQNAYETLSDSNKRAKYDAERSIFKGRNERRSRDDYYSNDEFLKREKEEIKRREEELKRKEEEFRRKEQSYTKPEAKTDNKRSTNKIASFLLIPLVIIVIVGVNKSGVFKKQNPPEKGPWEKYQIVEESETNETTTGGGETTSNNRGVSPSTNSSNKINLEAIKDSQILNNLTKGLWEGAAYQSNINESWAIKLSFNNETHEFKIAYPSLNCTAYWEATNVTNSKIEFIEVLKTGQNICNDGGKIVLNLLSETRIEYLYYWPDDRTLDSKGEIKRIRL